MQDSEKAIIIKETPKTTSCADIAKLLGHHVRTVKRFLENPSSRKQRSDRGKNKTASKRDLRNIKRQVMKSPSCTSKIIFKRCGMDNVTKTTGNRILNSVAMVKSPQKKPPLTKRHMGMRVKWARSYMKQDMKFVLFMDETHAMLDGPDGWSKGWVRVEGKIYQRFHHHQGRGGLMLWTGIINNELVGPIKAHDGMKINAATYCDPLDEVLVSWLDQQTLALCKKLVFMQDNAPAQSRNNTLLIWVLKIKT